MSDSCVYVRDNKEGWLPATVLSHPENQPDRVVVRVFSVDGHAVVDAERTVSLKDYPDNSLPLQNVDASGNFMEMADLVDLPSLHEAAILYNLRARHMARKPYTRVGDLIIAVNPFQWIQDLYSDETRHRYNKLIFTQDDDPTAASMMSPHVYETAALSYRGLTLNEQHQSILVSGESGAGKTETVKIVMRQLASIQQTSSMEASPDDLEHGHHSIVQRVLDSHPLLEAFGNAKTVRNDNSSRFGKFIQMQFDVEDVRTAQLAGRAIPHCVMAGSTVETYLLEKSRVVGHDDLMERNYHIFYQILAASDDHKEKIWKDGLVGSTYGSYRYVGETSTNIIEGKTDQERFERTVAALELMNVKDDKLTMLLRAVCVVMQLGNLVFAEDPNDSEHSILTSGDELQRLAELMGISELEDVQKALLFRTVVAGKETYTVPLRVADARDGCDAFAKEIYQQIFEWLVRQVNEMTCAESNYEHAGEVEGRYGLIGLLDIFGFESFEVNRFEQLCINYTNEKLQQKYTLDIFRSVQEEYAQEGIALANISYEDNAEVLRLLEGRVGIISILNEECVRPKGNDLAFVAKVKSVNAESKQLIQERLHKPAEFGIVHYAGRVTYDATNFVQKNTDALPNDLIECACKCSNDIVRVELKAAADAKEGGATGGPAKKRGGATVTVATKFKHQLHQLMNSLSQTQSRYIRCIKPNPEKVPYKMHMMSSTEQLRCAGVVAAVTISRVAFPNRLLHETALERFMCLSSQDLDVCFSEEKKDDEEAVIKDCVYNLFSEVLRELEVPSDEDPANNKKAFECGRSRVYFRAGALEFLERKRLLALGVFATLLQKMARSFVARSKYLKLKSASVFSVACARRVIARKRYFRALSAVLDIECWIRSLFARWELTRLRRQKAATQLQSRWRTAQARSKFRKTKESTVNIQRIARGAIQRPKYRIALKEAEEEARVNSKLAALQKRLHDAEMKLIRADKMRQEAETRAATLEAGGISPSSAAAGESQGAVKVNDDSATQPPASSLQQQLLIDESNQMLDYFRTEVFKLKSANYLLRNDLATAKTENQQLFTQNQSLEASVGALRQNIQRLSETNLQLGTTSSKQKDELYKLKQDFKMENLRHASEIKRALEESSAKDRTHEQELARLKRELERFRRVAKSTPPKVKGPYERAPFVRVSNDSNDDANMSRSSSMVNFEDDGGPDSEVWGHDGYFQSMSGAKGPVGSGSDRKGDSKSRSSATWTMLKRKKGNVLDDDSSHSSRAGSKGNDSAHSRGAGSRGSYGGKFKKQHPPSAGPFPKQSNAGSFQPKQSHANPLPNPGPGNNSRKPLTLSGTPSPKTKSPPLRSSSIGQSTPISRSNSTTQSTSFPRSNSSLSSAQGASTILPAPTGTSSLALAAAQGKQLQQQQLPGKPKKVSVVAGPGGGGSGSKGPYNPSRRSKKQ